MKVSYRCPHCGDTKTQEEMEEATRDGGLFFCWCEWTAENRVYNTYEKIEEEEYIMKLRIADTLKSIEFMDDYSVIIRSEDPEEPIAITLTENELGAIYATYREMEHLSTGTDYPPNTDFVLSSGIGVWFEGESLIEFYDTNDDTMLKVDPGDIVMAYTVNRKLKLDKIEENINHDK